MLVAATTAAAFLFVPRLNICQISLVTQRPVGVRISDEIWEQLLLLLPHFICDFLPRDGEELERPLISISISILFPAGRYAIDPPLDALFVHQCGRLGGEMRLKNAL